MTVMCPKEAAPTLLFLLLQSQFAITAEGFGMHKPLSIQRRSATNNWFLKNGVCPRRRSYEKTTSLNVGAVKNRFFNGKPTPNDDDGNDEAKSAKPMNSDPFLDVDGTSEEGANSKEIVANLSNKKNVFQLATPKEYNAFLDENPDTITVLKFYAPWCRACKGLAPKFTAVANDERYETLPMKFAEMSVEHNRDFVKQIGILALPSVHIYSGSDGLVESFPCGPSKVPILKRKIADVVNERVDETTRRLRLLGDPTEETSDAPCAERVISTTEGDVIVKEEQIDYLRNEIPYFTDLSQEEFDGLISKARLLSFPPGSVIIRQGQPGDTFYVIQSGEVEILVKSSFQDPLQTPSNYLGTSLNTLTTNNFFGERSLILDDDRAASIRAIDRVRCFAFNKEDIPTSSVLSGSKSASSDRLVEIDNKYGVDLDDIYDVKDKGKMKELSMTNQQRGSVWSPRPIPGVDNDEPLIEEDVAAEKKSPAKDDMILTLLFRFKQVRQAAKCFEYIMNTQPRWGDTGEMNRRLLLVSKLSSAQRQEFKEVFHIIDKTHDNHISLMEMKSFMDSVGVEKTEDELKQMLSNSSPLGQVNVSISFDEFMGVMAEAEFYYLFNDTFNALDKMGSGFVRAGDLDRVLCGMRDLISDDRMSIIDVEDQDMLIDYEQFSKQLLGAAL